MSDVHVYPINDLKEHDIESAGCHCNPRIEVHGANLLIIHNAYDFRELYESGDILQEIA